MIIKLHQNLINQIAAGEVVERPASVLKEIIENAIDAKASKIDIRIQQSGLKSIEVRDNGIGMARDDVRIALDPHTTSKISSIQDLDSISSMGFRGEALASISSVSKLTLISRSKKDKRSFGIHVDGNKRREVEETQFPNGTTVIVEDIFYNIPARKKFLKTLPTEYRHSLDTFIRYALAFPNIHFTFTHNKKEIYNLPPETSDNFNEELRVRLQDLFKRDIFSDMVSLNYSSPTVRIFGSLSHPRVAKSSKTHQYIFLNKRPIEDRLTSKAIIAAYESFIPKGKFPFYVIFLELDPSQVDVNVHPRKTEVRYRDSQSIYQSVFNASRQTLTKFLKQDSDKALQQYKHLLTKNQYKKFQKRTSIPQTPYTRTRTKNIRQSLSFTKQILKQDDPPLQEEDFFGNVFQVFQTYVIIEKSDKLLIIDQHAASERITYDILRRQMRQKNIVTQKLLLPQTIEIDEKEKKVLSEYKDTINNLGFSYSSFGKETIKIDELPALLAKSNIKDLFSEVLLELAEGEMKKTPEGIKSLKKHILATMACHTSIRAGMKLTREEVYQLVKDLLACEHPYSCPHGRPIMWELQRSEIEKHVARH